MDWLFGACTAPTTEGDLSFGPKKLKPIKFEGPVNLPGMSGTQGLISSPMTENELGPDDWRELFVWSWKNYEGKCPIQQPAVYKDLGDGNTHRSLLYQATGFMAWITSISVELHEVLSEPDENTLILCNYTDGGLKEMSKRRTIRLHRHPEFRVSVTFEKFPARDAVNTPSVVLQQILDALGKSELKVNRGQASPLEDGKLSALTDPLEEGTTIEQVYEKAKEFLDSKKSEGFLVRDDGVFETEVKDGLITNSGMKSRWFQPKDGVFEVLQILPNGELLTTTYVRVSAGPPLVAEAWTIEPQAIDYAKMGENEQDRTNIMMTKSFDSWTAKNQY